MNETLDAFRDWLSDPAVQMLVVIYGGSWLCMGMIGLGIGRTRGRGGDGFLLGFLLGPIGWLVILLLERHGRKCPECLGIVPEAAIRCRHCGIVLPDAPVAKNPFRRRVI